MDYPAGARGFATARTPNAVVGVPLQAAMSAVMEPPTGMAHELAKRLLLFGIERLLQRGGGVGELRQPLRALGGEFRAKACNARRIGLRRGPG